MKLIIRKYNQEFFTVNAQPTIIRLIVRNGDGGGNSSSGVQSVNAGTNVTITGTATNPIINATGGGSSYLSYVVKLPTPNGSSVPIAVVLKDDIGFGDWVRVTTGFYAVSSELSFTPSQIYINGFAFDNAEGNSIFIPIYNNQQTIIGYYTFSYSSNEGLLDLALLFTDGTMTPCDMDAIFTEAKQFYVPEVRVYPT